MRVQFFETLWEQFRERLLSLLSVGNDFQSISVPKELSTVPIPFPWNSFNRKISRSHALCLVIIWTLLFYTAILVLALFANQNDEFIPFGMVQIFSLSILLLPRLHPILQSLHL